MKPSIVSTLLFALSASASPTPIASHHPITKDALKERGNWAVTRNELSGACKPVTVIFARGTIELGNVGSFAGPHFFNALDDAIGASNVAYQGVDYPALVSGYLAYLAGKGNAGADTVANLASEAASKCPETQIVLSGYSQGAQVVRAGVDKLSSEVAARVSAVVSHRLLSARNGRLLRV